ncbi:MAG: hypothetical protein QNJ00_11965 [Woeseiaceae bacterium]|nr:hypothetical protein [Woeseiaceae bacterium]
MNLQKWALLAEILGGIAVVVSLIFVGYQIQQSNEQAALNTTALQVTAYQQLIDGISEFNTQTIQNQELRSARIKVEAGAQFDELSAEEQEIFNAFLYLAYRNGDLAYFQFQKGIIDEERLRSGMGLLVNYLALPTVRRHWDERKEGFVTEYRDYIDQLIEDAETPE